MKGHNACLQTNLYHEAQEDVAEHDPGASGVESHKEALHRLAASSTTARLHTLTLSNVDSWLVVDGRVAHPLLDLSCHRQECLLDIAGVLS